MEQEKVQTALPWINLGILSLLVIILFTLDTNDAVLSRLLGYPEKSVPQSMTPEIVFPSTPLPIRWPTPTPTPYKKTVAVPTPVAPGSLTPTIPWGQTVKTDDLTSASRFGADSSMSTADELFTAVNNFRMAHGVSALQKSTVLCQIADTRARQLQSMGKLDNHEGFHPWEKTSVVESSQILVCILWSGAGGSRLRGIESRC